MKKLVLLLFMLPFAANAGVDNAWGVNQEKLDIYRASHPRYNFPANISDLIEAQSKQVLEYFYDNYRFDDYKYDEIADQVWDIFIHMSIADTEAAINNCIAKYYEFNEYNTKSVIQPKFYAPLGSIDTVKMINGIKPDNVPKMLECMYAIKY